MGKFFQITGILLAGLAVDYCRTKIKGSYDFPVDDNDDNKNS